MKDAHLFPPEKEVVQVSYGAEGILSEFPEEQLERKVRIFKHTKHNMQSGLAVAKPWRIELDTRPRWVNGLMGYQSGSDPLGCTGVRNVAFDSLEEAMRYCKQMGFKFTVDRVVPTPDFEGKKGYHQNFLNYHVANRRKKMSPGKFAKYQFSHEERGKSAWVNLKHTDYGATESKMVSQTHWKDEEHPANHSGEDWRYDNFAKRAELAKKLGK